MLAGLSDLRLAALVALGLFVQAAWPLGLVDLPPLQDLPNHVATAHIIAHPELYPQYAFNGYFKSNALLTTWLHVAGAHDLYGAARIFTAFVLAVNALGLTVFVLRFAGRRTLLVAALFVWPLVHGFFVSMGMLNFACAFGLSLLLLAMLDRQRARPSRGWGLGVAGLSVGLWYAHPLPLAVVGVLVFVHAATRATTRERVRSGLALLLPLAPAVLLAFLAALQHLVKAEHASSVAAAAFAYLNPWEILEHFWLDGSGALTHLGSLTVVPAVLLLVFAWRQRAVARPFFFTAGTMAGLAVAYLGLPVMVSNWWYFHCRLVPFLWAGLAVRLPGALPRPVVVLLAACGLASSAALGLDYVRLDRDRATFTAGMDAVPARATLLPLLFEHAKTSQFTASLTHAWAFYTVEKDTSAPLVFAVERSYPITYREFPPRALVPPALDDLAERHGTSARLCKSLGQLPGDPVCETAWRALWESFWRQAEPRFSHVLTWAMPAEARALVPARYHRTFVGPTGELEIFARDAGAPSPAPALPP